MSVAVIETSEKYALSGYGCSPLPVIQGSLLQFASFWLCSSLSFCYYNQSEHSKGNMYTFIYFALVKKIKSDGKFGGIGAETNN